MKLLNNSGLLNIRKRELVITGHDASQSLHIVTVERHDMNAVNWLTSFSTTCVAATAAMAFNNPHTAFITCDNLQWRNGATVHQIVKQVVICLAGAFVVFTLVETFTHVDMVKADKHPGIGALDGPVTGHLLE